MPALRDVLQWEVRTWSRALPLWARDLPAQRPLKALAVGEREGGLALWLAAQGVDVTCTDLNPFPAAMRALHERYKLSERITYAQADVTALEFPSGTFDVVVFKSVIGALGSKERQAVAIKETQRVLRPGGVLLFAENLSGSSLHGYLRKRFVRWATYWRYLCWPEDADLFSSFSRVEVARTGLLAPFGRSEWQRDLLARLDRLLELVTPAAWRTVLYGVCTK